MHLSPLFVFNYCQDLFFKRITVFELEDFDTIFELECLADWFQGTGVVWKIFGAFGVLAELERSPPAGVCGQMETLCIKADQ